MSLLEAMYPRRDVANGELTMNFAKTGGLGCITTGFWRCFGLQFRVMTDLLGVLIHRCVYGLNVRPQITSACTLHYS